MDPNLPPQSPVPADPQQPVPPAPAEPPVTPEPSQPEPQQPQPLPEQQSYTEIIASSLLELLNKANANEDLLAKVADEMEISKDSVKTMLSGLLGKVSQGAITKEELALIMTAPILEENT